MNTFTSVKSISIVATMAVLLATPLLSSAVIRSSQVSETEIVIQYSASELNTVEGLANIEQQVERAAKELCGPSSYSTSHSLRDRAVVKVCITNAITRAQEDLQSGATQLTIR